MTLLVDIGNSRIKWARLVDGVVRDEGAAPHRDEGSLLPREVLPAPEPAGGEVLAASVADPALTEEILQILAPPGVRLTIARSEDTVLGLRNGYRDPGQLGVDRWLAMVAAWSRYHSALCVADVGTAVTVDLVAADGRHLGGVIVPGPELMATALHRDTGRITAAAARLAGEASSAPVTGDSVAGLGRDTDAGIGLGGLLAAAALIDRCVQLASGVGGSPRLVITGGGAQALQPHLRCQGEYRPRLVLEGLAVRNGMAMAPEVLRSGRGP